MRYTRKKAKEDLRKRKAEELLTLRAKLSLAEIRMMDLRKDNAYLSEQVSRCIHVKWQYTEHQGEFDRASMAGVDLHEEIRERLTKNLTDAIIGTLQFKTEAHPIVPHHVQITGSINILREGIQ